MNIYMCIYIYSGNKADRLLYKNRCHLYYSLVKKAQYNYFSSPFNNCSDSNLCSIQSTKFVIALAHPH